MFLFLLFICADSEKIIPDYWKTIIRSRRRVMKSAKKKKQIKFEVQLEIGKPLQWSSVSGERYFPRSGGQGLESRAGKLVVELGHT